LPQLVVDGADLGEQAPQSGDHSLRCIAPQGNVIRCQVRHSLCAGPHCVRFRGSAWRERPEQLGRIDRKAAVVSPRGAHSAGFDRAPDRAFR
jgi:hypothetical protein